MKIVKNLVNFKNRRKYHTKRLAHIATVYDDINESWSNDSELLNQRPFLEEYLILRTVRALSANVSMSRCPKLLEAQPNIPVASFNKALDVENQESGMKE